MSDGFTPAKTADAPAGPQPDHSAWSAPELKLDAAAVHSLLSGIVAGFAHIADAVPSASGLGRMLLAMKADLEAVRAGLRPPA